MREGIVVKAIIADYDGAFGFMFHRLLRSTSQSLTVQANKNKVIGVVKKINSRISNDLEGADVVEFYNGSIRQTERIDKFNQEHNDQVGLCLENFPKLCDERGWNYNKDIVNKYHTGRFKSPILQKQLDHLRQMHADKGHIEVFFYDDDHNDELFSELEKNIDMPHNMTLTMVKFDGYTGITCIEQEDKYLYTYLALEGPETLMESSISECTLL